MNPTINYLTAWNEADFNLLKQEYQKLSELYYEKSSNEDVFYFSPFDKKISAKVLGENKCKENCQLDFKEINIVQDGGFYPCIQFVNDPEYYIGNWETGIDYTKRMDIFMNSTGAKESCKECAIKDRCLQYCACLSKATMGNTREASPFVCSHERIVIPIADRLATRLYKEKNVMFIHKHYNNFYTFLAMLEDGIKF